MDRNLQLAKAHDLLRRGQLQAAEAACRALLAVASRDADALHLLGLVRKQAGDLDQAETLLRSSVEAAPDRAEYHANLGNLLRSRGRIADAELAYRMALQLSPQLRTARLGLARLLCDASLHAAAAGEAQQLLAANARDAEAWSTLGIALRGQGRHAEAEAAYRKALDIAPGYAAARHNLGALLSQQQRAEEALAELDRAAGAGLVGREIAFNRGRALADLARFDEAEQSYLAALAADPGHLDTQVALAKLRYMRGDRDFAREFQRGEQARPSDVRLRMAHGQVLRQAGDAVAAERILRDVLKSEGFIPEVASALAIVLHEQGRLAEAATEARAARDARPENAALDEALVGVLLTLGEPEECLALVRRQRELAPLDQRWIAYEATALRLQGDDEYHRLYDYARFVQPFELEPPAGWATIEAFNRDLIEVLLRLHRFQSHPLDQSLRLGTQTPRSLLVEPDPVIRTFLKAIETPIAEYRSAIGQDPLHPLTVRNAGASQLVGCWSVRLQRGGYHVNHTHPAGWISSAYYVEVPPEVADETAQSGWIKFGEPGLPVPGASPERLVQPKPGRLVLFPSYMWHGTTPITGDQARMTVAFDVIPNPQPR